MPGPSKQSVRSPITAQTSTADSAHARAASRLARHVLAALPALVLGATAALANDASAVRGGELRIIDSRGTGGELGICPLVRTEVECDITGFIARTTVRQVFYNPSKEKIEAVYVFPLPEDAAVDDMVMLVGDRRIVGQIKPREEARAIYERARDAGQVASLLDQERTNIFTQSVTNIDPGVQVVIEISFVQTLKFEDGVFEWVFPMVVGPRYIPGGGSAPQPGQTGTPTDQVPDADKITPPVVAEGKRAGHDIRITVWIDGGMQVLDLRSELHEVDVTADGTNKATVKLRNENEIPNKDFILRYRLGNDQIGDAFLTYTDERGSFFTLILQPPQRVVPEQLVNRELVFVLDTSGSMSGFPIEKAKEVMSKAIGAMRSGDTFNVITFAGDTSILWEEPRPATRDNIAAAQGFLETRQGGGGTEMMKAIEAALVQQKRGEPTALTAAELAELPADGREVLLRVPYESWSNPNGGEFLEVLIRDALTLRVTPKRAEIPWVKQGGWCPVGEPIFVRGRWMTVNGERVLQATAQMHKPGGTDAIRVVVFMTDGYVGNDMEIIDAVRKNAGTTRVFSLGIGNSVNRALLEGMASAGRGEVEYVTLEGQADAAVERLHERILAPVLTDISIDWGDLPVADVLPTMIPDLFSAKPVMIHGRLTGPASGTIVLRGNTGNGAFERRIVIDSQTAIVAHADRDGRSALASLWARAKVNELMLEDMLGVQRGTTPEERKAAITALGVEFRLMTQFTSFVAVEEMMVTIDGQPKRIIVPVEMPDGVSYEGVFADSLGKAGLPALAPAAPTGGARGGRGVALRMSQTAPPQPRERSRGDDADEARDSDPNLPQPEPREKLAESLRDLAIRVEREGTAGTLKTGSVTVTGYQIAVMISLNELSDATRSALAALGFVISGESNATRLLIGSIDVRKLDELARLDAVTRVTPVAP